MRKPLFLIWLLLFLTVLSSGQDRVMRRPTYTATPFAPTDIASLKYWYKSDSISQSDGTTILSWLDSSPNTYALTQGIPGARPVFKTNQLNGKPSVRFDGTDDEMNDSASRLTAAPHTVFVVGFSTSIAAGYTRFAYDDNFRWGRTAAKLSFTTIGVQDYVTAADQLSASTPVILAFVYDSSFDMSFYKNGSFIETVTGSADPSAGGAMFVGSGAGAEYWAGDLFELCGFTTALTSGEISDMFTYLNGRYAIY